MEFSPEDALLVLSLTREGSLAGAAQSLGLSSSTLQRALRRLEQDIGRPLFVRAASGITPTPLALSLLPAAQSIEDELEIVAQTIAAGGKSFSGRVSIALPGVVMEYVLAPLLADLHRLYPAIVLELDVKDWTSTPPLDEMRDITFYLGNVPPEMAVRHELFEVKRGVAAAHSLLAGRDRSQLDLTQEKWVKDGGRVVGTWVRREYPDVSIMHVGVTQWVVRVVNEGVGVGVVPDFAFSADKLAWAVPDVPDLRTKLWLLCPRSVKESPRVQAVSEFFMQRLRPTDTATVNRPSAA